MSGHWIPRGLWVATACCAVVLTWNSSAYSQQYQSSLTEQMNLPQAVQSEEPEQLPDLQSADFTIPTSGVNAKSAPLSEAAAVIHTDQDVFGKGQPVRMHVRCTEKTFRVTLSKREDVAAYRTNLKDCIDCKPGSLYPLSFDVPADVDGVLAVTVWDEKNVPLAERLVMCEAGSSK